MTSKGVSDGMREIARKIKARIDKAKELEKQGANKFKQLEARLTDQETGKLIQDIVITAIMDLETVKDAKSFYQGYIEDITNNPDKYPEIARKDPAAYAEYDTGLAIQLHFTDPKIYRRWRKVNPNLC